MPATQLGEGAIGDDDALVEDDHAVGESFCFVQLVGGQHDRASSVGEGAHDAAYGVAAVHIDAGGRLVEERHLRRGGQCQGQRDPLLLAATEPAPGGRAPIGQADLLHQRCRVDALAVQRAVVAHRVEHARAWVHTAFLQHHPHAFAEQPLLGRRVEAQHSHSAGGCAPVSLAHFDRAGLARAVGPQHCSDLAGRGAERHIVHCPQLAVALGQTRHLDSCHGRESTSAAWESPWGLQKAWQ